MKSTPLKPVLCSSVSMLAVCAIAFSAPAFAQDAAKAAPVAAPADDSATTVVITSRRKALQSATDRKKNSDTMIDSIVADDAGKLPDNSITEVLQRVSGVTIARFAALNDPDHFSAEGSGIQVRGLSGVMGTLNGHEVFSANGGGGLSWGDVTPELMSAVDVYKANRADMLEGGTGGSIDLRTKMPFDYKKPALNASLGYSYGDYIKKGSPNGSLLATKRWDTPAGEFGVLVDLAYSDYNAGDSFLRQEPYWKHSVGGVDRYIPGGFDYGDDQFERKRTGLYEATQWRPNDSLTLYQTFFQSEYKSHNTGAGVFVGDRNRLLPDPAGTATYDSNGALVSASHMIIASNADGNAGSTIGQSWIPDAQQVDCNTPYGTQAQALNWSTSPTINGGNPYCSPTNISIGSSRGYSTSDNITREFSQGFTWMPTEKLRVVGNLQFVDSSARSTSFGVGLHSNITGYSVDNTGKFPVYVVDNSAALSSRTNYGWDNIADRVTNNHGTMGAGQIDIDYDLGDGFFKTLKVGGRYANRVERDNYDGTYWAALGAGWNGSDQRDLTAGKPTDTELYNFDNFFKGAAPLPAKFYFPSAGLVQSQDALYVQNTYGYTDQNNGAVALPLVYHDPFGFARTQVITRSVYVETKFGSDTGFFGVPFTGNAGIRVVRNEVDSTGFFTFGANQFYLSQADANADLAKNGQATSYYQTLNSGFSRSATNDYTKYLPSINLNFKPTDKFFIRVAANITMSPPGYNDIRATGSGGITTIANSNNVPDNPATPLVDESKNYPAILTGVTANSGNPALLPTMSNNLDLAFEWYPSNSLNAHFDLFHKDLHDLILYGDTTKPFSTVFNNVDGSSTIYSTTLTSTEVYNSTKTAHLSGAELGARKFFDELPKPFDGFGIEANYTYIDSQNPGTKAYDINGKSIGGTPIVGMSRNNYNVQFMYEKKNLSLRLAYSWRSKYLQSTNANGTNGSYTYATATGAQSNINIGLPVYGAAYGQWDAGFNYTFNDHLKLWVQANNLTNETTKTLMGGYPNGALYTRSWFISDQRIDMGLNIAF